VTRTEKPRDATGASPDERDDLAKARILRCLQPFEQRHLRTSDFDSVTREAEKGGFLVFSAPRSDGVGNDNGFAASLGQTKRCLQNADMRLAALVRQLHRCAFIDS
jgi:hypothetical protein